CRGVRGEGVAGGLAILFRATIVRVRQGGGDVGRGNGRQKDFLMWQTMQRRLQGGNVGLHRRVSLVADGSRTGIDTVLAVATSTAKACRNALRPGVVVGERQIFSARCPWVAYLFRRDRLQLEAV